jgi:hypothetical protein
MKTSMISFLVALLFCGFVSAVAAQEFSHKGACKADEEKFCKDVKPGQGRIVRCMKAHENELSQGCRALIAEGREKEQEFVRSCKSDETKFCKDVKPGGGRIIHCLKGHQAELSPACKTYFQKK